MRSHREANLPQQEISGELSAYLTLTEDDRDLGSVEVVCQLFIDTARYLHVDHSIALLDPVLYRNGHNEAYGSPR
jgi:hypothetical protein